MSAQSQHLAAISNAKGSPLAVTHRTTPTPGPNEVLIEVKSLALNPIDYYMRDFGFVIDKYPSIFGSDVGGIIIETGSSATKYKHGTRVAAFATAFFAHGAPDYGAFQAKVLVPEANVTALPESVGFNEASLLPMSVVTAWSGWWTIGLPLKEKLFSAAEKKSVLVCIGGGAVQSAKLLGFTVYATASEKHHDYIKQLGAKEVFEYKAADVVEQIIKAAKEDGVTVQHAFDAAGQVQSCLDVLSEFKSGGEIPQLATAVPMSDQTPKGDGVDVKFVAAPTDAKENAEFFGFVMNDWLKRKLESGEYRPSPGIKVVPGGLEGLNKGLDELKAGVSGTKLVLEL